MNQLEARIRVPFFGLDRQYRRYRSEFLEITDKVLSHGQVLQGPEVAELEQTLARICGRLHAVALGSCTDALAFALTGCGVGPGDEVLVTALSFIASASPILRVGAKPRFVDVESDYYMMDLGLLDRLVTPRTKALIAVHLYGQTLPMAELEEFARRYNLALVEDAAQAIGARDGDRPAGSMGRVSCLSFDPTKVIGSFGSAGAIVTDDPAIARIAHMLRYHGRDPDTRQYQAVGFNSQLSSEMAAMLNFKLSKISEWQKARERIANTYLISLSGIEKFILPAVRPGSTHNWHKFVLRVSDREALANALRAAGVQTMVHYPRALPDEPVINQLTLAPEATNIPNARQLVGEVLSLPIYPDLSLAEAQYVSDCIRGYYASR